MHLVVLQVVDDNDILVWRNRMGSLIVVRRLVISFLMVNERHCGWEVVGRR